MSVLIEDKRSQLLSSGKQGKKQHDGKNRFQKRLKSKIKASVQELNKVNFNQLFKDNIVTVTLQVDGETSTYNVSVSFGGFLDELHRELERSNDILSLRVVIRALLTSFNSDNVYIKCDCPDFKYRHAFWASRNNIIVGDKENRPSDKTNPDDSLGHGCKHIMLVISNTSWIIKLASVVYNYINYMEKHYKKLYADVIYPAVYDKEYEEPVQLDIDSLNKDSLDTDSSTIDKSNIEARDRGKFKAGNKLGVRFASKPNTMKNLPVEEAEDGEE